MTAPPARPPERVPRELKVPVTAVGARGGPGRAARFAAIAVVVVIAGSVASSRLFPVVPAPVATDAPVASDATVATASAPAGSPGALQAPGLTPRITTAPVDVSGLVADVVDGSHSGWLVLIAGRLHASPLPCRSPAPLPGCMQLTIDGLRGLAVVADPTLTVWPGEPAPGSVLVLEVRGRKLVYLGSVVVDPAGIANVGGLRDRLAGTVPEPVGTLPTIFEADGWLVTGPLRSCGASASGCPPGTLFLAAEQPTADGRLRPGGVGLDVMMPFAAVTSDASTAGPFLLRRRAATDCGQRVGQPCFPNPDTWELVAREDPARTIRVLLPGS